MPTDLTFITNESLAYRSSSSLSRFGLSLVLEDLGEGWGATVLERFRKHSPYCSKHIKGQGGGWFK